MILLLARFNVIQMRVDIQRGVRLRFPGFHLAPGDSSQVGRVVKDNLPSKASELPAPVAIVRPRGLIGAVSVPVPAISYSFGSDKDYRGFIPSR